jgi:hypothetical protein
MGHAKGNWRDALDYDIFLLLSFSFPVNLPQARFAPGFCSPVGSFPLAIPALLSSTCDNQQGCCREFATFEFDPAIPNAGESKE